MIFVTFSGSVAVIVLRPCLVLLYQAVSKQHFTIVMAICYTCTQVFTVILKRLPGRFEISFSKDPWYLILNHGFLAI